MARKPKHDELDMSDDMVNEVKLSAKMTPAEETDFLQMVRENVAEGYNFWEEVFKQAEDDVRFRAGDQWPDYAKKDREASARPMLVFNDLPQYLSQIIGDQRQNRTSIQIAPADDTGASTEVVDTNGKKLKAAEAYEGLIRNIEYRSGAEAHYDTAYEHAVDGGFGWLRVLTEYSTPTSFDLDIRIKSLKNRWSAMIDPTFDEPDASDAEWGIVGDWMHEHQFRKLYPKALVGQLAADPAGWWGTKERIAVCEYFQRYAVERTLLLLQSGQVVFLDEHDERDLRAVGVVRERKVQTHKIQWFKLTSMSVLRGPVDVPCSTVPIVPVFGREVRGRDFVTFESLIRHAKDPKRADNFWMTAATERVALSPNAPWLVTPKMIEGFEGQWAAANRGTPAYLTYNPDGALTPTRQQPGTMPVAELQMAAAMTDKVKSAVGMYDAALGARSNETSAKAIMVRQRESDVGSFQFIDNLSRAIRRIGILCTEMIPRVYDGTRTVRLRFADGSGTYVRVNEPQDGKVINDLSVGAFDVVVKTGPSFTTQREEAANALTEFVRAVPSIGPIVMDKLVTAMDWPGAQEIADRLKMQLPPHMLSDEDRERLAEKMPEPQPSPEAMAQMAEAEASKMKAEADMASAEASKIMAQAKMMEAQAKMAEIEAGAITNDQMARVKQLIEETIAETLSTLNRGTSE